MLWLLTGGLEKVTPHHFYGCQFPVREAVRNLLNLWACRAWIRLLCKAYA